MVPGRFARLEVGTFVGVFALVWLVLLTNFSWALFRLRLRVDGEFDRVEGGLRESTGLLNFRTAIGNLEDGAVSEVGAGFGRGMAVSVCGLGRFPPKSLYDLLRPFAGLDESSGPV